MKKWGNRFLVVTVTAGLLGGASVWSQVQKPVAPAPTIAPTTKTVMAVNPMGKVNINTADEAALMTLKGIGKGKAKTIIEYRQKNGPFKSVDDLTKVKGIGDKTLTQLRDLLTVE
ncbi:MAG: ComEA family DNA-binding protein [Candidatus Binatia bacterium]